MTDKERLLLEAISTLRSAKKRLDLMGVKEIKDSEGYVYKAILPDKNILSYELSVMAEKLEDEIEQ